MRPIAFLPASLSLLLLCIPLHKSFGQGYLHDAHHIHQNSNIVQDNLLIKGGADAYLSFEGQTLYAYNLNNDLEWSVQYPLSFQVKDVEMDANGSVYLVGETSDSLDFDPDPDDTHVDGAYYDVLSTALVKLNSDGQFQWVRMLNSEGEARAAVVDVGPDENIYVGGTHSGTTTYFQNNITLESPQSAFVACFKPSGSNLWFKQISGDSANVQLGYSRLNDIQVDADTNLIIAGSYSGTIYPDFNGESQAITAVDVTFAPLLLKFDKDQEFLWRKNTIIGTESLGFFTPARGNALELAVDEQNNVYFSLLIGGDYFDVTPQGLIEVQDARNILLKLNENGYSLWVKGYKRSGPPGLSKIHVNSSNQLVFTNCGDMSNSYLILDYLRIQPLISANGVIHIFSPEGELVWEHYISNISGNNIRQIAVSSVDNDMLLHCYFKDSIDVDPTGFVNNQNTIGNQKNEVVMRWSNCTNTVRDQFIESCLEYISPQGYTISESTAFFKEFYPRQNQCDSIVEYFIDIVRPIHDIIVHGSNQFVIAETMSDSIQWHRCNGSQGTMNAIQGETNDTLFLTNLAGYYALTASLGSCKDTSDCIFVYAEGLNTIEHESSTFNVYPNPSSGHLTIETASFDRPFSLSIVNTDGRVVWKETITNSTQIIQVDLPTGYYILSSGTMNEPLLIQK